MTQLHRQLRKLWTAGFQPAALLPQGRRAILLRFAPQPLLRLLLVEV